MCKFVKVSVSSFASVHYITQIHKSFTLMKGLALLLLGAVTFVQAHNPQRTLSGKICNCNPTEAAAVCSKNDSEGELVVHEHCNQFYKCSDGKAVAFFCPSNLLYNPLAEICDWPQDVDCKFRPIVEEGEADCSQESNEQNNGGSSGENGGVSDNESGNENDNHGTCNCNPGEAPSICAADGSDGVLVTHENCNQFYKCDHGVPVALNCYGNLVYNPYTEQCDWPHNVECGDRPIAELGGENNGSNGNGDSESEESKENEESGNENIGNGSGENTRPCNCNAGEAPRICSADGSDGTLVAHENCNQFYKCANGSPVTISCPSGLLYNPYIESCDWSHNVVCGDKPIVEVEGGNNGNGDSDNENNGSDNGGSEDNESGNGNGDESGTCNCNPGEAPEICAADGSEGTLIAHENCNQFYKCNYGSPVTFTCPAGLLYNPYIECCDWPHNVECGDRPVVEGGESGGSDNGGSNENGDNESGHGNGGNGDHDNTGTCNCNPGEAPEICSADGADGTLVAHVNCNQFYKCANGLPVTISCPSGLLYNPYIESCDWPHNVVCGDKPIVEVEGGNNGNGDNDNENNGSNNGGSEDNESENGNGDESGTCNCNPGEAPEICAADGSEGTLIAHENCNQFYKCNYGSPVTFTCPAGLLYNPYIECCDWPHNVECGDRPVVEGGESGGSDNGGSNENGDNESGHGNGGNGDHDNTGTCNCNPGEAPEICSADGADGTLVAHVNCNQFYKCANGLPVTISCPSGLLYNPYIESCDWPHNVVCGDKPIVEVEGGNNGNGDNDNENNGSNNGGSEDNESENGNSDNSGTCNCNPGEAPGICAADGSDGILIAHEHCNQFYKCNHGVPVSFKCSGMLLYNPHTEQCDWHENVKCGDRPIVEVDGGDNDNGGTGDNSNEDGDDSENEIGSNSCNCNPEDAPAICATGNSEGVLIAHEKCNKFYKCSYGSPVAMKCPGNLLYNPVLEVCDWPQNVQCVDRIVPEVEEVDDNNGNDNNNNGGDSCSSGPNTDPSEAPAICQAHNSNGILVAHEDCDKFYVCSNGSPVALQCPSNLLYNPSSEECDWSRNVECGNRNVPEVEAEEESETCLCNSRQAPSVCAGGDSNGKMIAHENCNQFYVCFNGKAIARSCPTSLFYEPHTTSCNWAAAVNCEGRDVTTHLSLNKHMQARRGIL